MWTLRAFAALATCAPMSGCLPSAGEPKLGCNISTAFTSWISLGLQQQVCTSAAVVGLWCVCRCGVSPSVPRSVQCLARPVSASPASSAPWLSGSLLAYGHMGNCSRIVHYRSRSFMRQGLVPRRLCPSSLSNYRVGSPSFLAHVEGLALRVLGDRLVLFYHAVRSRNDDHDDVTLFACACVLSALKEQH